MKKMLLLGIISWLAIPMIANNWIDTSEENWTYGRMHQWRVHTAFVSTNEIVVMKDRVYALSNHALFSVDKQSQLVDYHNRLTGLNSSMVVHISHSPTLDVVLVNYQNGQIDIIDAEGSIYNIPDLYLKQMNSSKVINSTYIYDTKAYMSMPFGIIVLDLQKREIRDTYYIGNNSEVDVQAVTILGDSIYAISDRSLYVASLSSNLMDYVSWVSHPLPSGSKAKDLYTYDDQLYMVRDSTLWSRSATTSWKACKTPFYIEGLCQTDDELFILPKDTVGITKVGTDYSLVLEEFGTIYDIKQDEDSYWFCTLSKGVYSTKLERSFYPHGPCDNTAYRMRFFGDRLYVVPGGRWATQNSNPGNIMYYENNRWTNIYSSLLFQTLGMRPLDLMNVAQDPKDDNHYFVTSYGSGLLEMYNKEVINHYTPENSPLLSAASGNPLRYTRTDGAIYDDQGNLWVLNTECEKNIHILSPDQTKWTSFSLTYKGNPIEMATPGEIMIDNRNPQWKWIPLCRYNTGLILLKDNGTPTEPSDDQVVYRSIWYDQNNNQIMPAEIHSLAQDLDGVLWVGTNEGLFLIPPTIDFATSDYCERVIIPRNDGTNLADYLLDNEKITSIVVDGANRKWIGTANSGVFLLSADGLETVEHFTVDNSPLLSNTILSIAIQESTGEVYIGTSDGLMSYMSDAVPAKDNFSDIYIYPNPVHPTYKGYVVIKGLMANTEVRIVDASGNLVKVLQGLGGEVLWDVTNTTGNRVASGVYTAICNTSDGGAYGTAKVLIIN